MHAVMAGHPIASCISKDHQIRADGCDRHKAHGLDMPMSEITYN